MRIRSTSYGKRGLTGAQCYISAEGVAGSNASDKAIGGDCLPPHFRSLMAFPMSLFGEDVSAVERVLTGFADIEDEIPGARPSRMVSWIHFCWIPAICASPVERDRHLTGGRREVLRSGMRKNGLKLVVAGGLTPENVGEAIEILQPWGVDVVSGVEARRGRRIRRRCGRL